MGKKKDSGENKAIPLTDTIRKEYEEASIPFLELPVHTQLSHEFRRVLAGKASIIVIGGKGTGKSESVHREVRQFRQEQLKENLRDPEYVQVKIVEWEASKCEGTKTSLVSLYGSLSSESHSVLNREQPRSLIQKIATHFHEENVHMLCVDEAQMIDASNLDLLRQVIDFTRTPAFPFGMILIGTPDLRAALSANQELGQRFGNEVSMRVLTRQELAQHLPDLHPGFKALKGRLPMGQWNETVESIFKATRGSFRPLRNVIESATDFALARGVEINQNAVKYAISSRPREA
jgi:DNA transposition AAA+ family ATPase